MFGGLDEGIRPIARAVMITVIITVPLGIWRLIEILIFLFKNISIKWGAQ